MKFFVKNFYETVKARVIIFGMQVDNDVWYRGIANQCSPAYSSLHLSNFLSFHTLNDEIFRQKKKKKKKKKTPKLCKLEYSFLVCT